MLTRVMRAYRVELAKAVRRRLTFLGPALMMIAVVALALTRGVGPETGGGYGFIAYAVPVALNLLGLLLLVMYCAGLIASELGSGSVCLVLVRPLRRSEWVAAKLLLGMTYALVLTVTVSASAWLTAYLRGDLTGVVIGGEVLYTNAGMVTDYALGMVLCLLPLSACAAYGILISTLTRSTGAAIGSAVGIWLLMDIVKYPLRIDRYVFSTYIETPWRVFNSHCNGLDATWFPEAGYAITTSLLFLFISAAVSMAVMSRRNLRS